mmetsp:Transcript_4539/g.6335  ORF Transcript_4539/g.6335 Transcript_4539/m.6335 type:complete len:250 (+) Transcript_4539:105-854(+)
MEIDLSKLDEIVPQELATKIRKSLEVIKLAFEKYSMKQISFSFNGGKDCTVLLHLIHMFLLDKNATNNNNSKTTNQQTDLEAATKPCSQFLTVCFMIPDSFDEEVQFMQKAADIYGLKLHVIHKPIKEGLESLLKQFQVDAIFMGTRRTDPYCSNMTAFQMTDPDWPQIMRVNPILDWDYHDIWAFIKAFEIPYCTLYDQGYTSLGSTKNTVPNPQLRQPNGSYSPASMLQDSNAERSGRVKRSLNQQT